MTDMSDIINDWPELGRSMGIDHERQKKWDLRFVWLARIVSDWSKDPSTKVGAVIVRPDNTVAALGYNGFPRGTSDASDIYGNRDRKLSRVIHAELNAILSAREPLHGYTLYTWPPCYGPTCDRCAAHVIQAGIARVVGVVASGSSFSERWKAACQEGLDMYKEAGVRVTMYGNAGHE